MRNGTGGYQLPANSFNPAVNGVAATAADWNSTAQDIQAAIEQSVSSDGQTPMTGNLNMNGNKIAGLANASASGDAVSLGRLDETDGASLIGYQPAGAGAVATTVEEQLRNQVWITDFAGSDKTGATDSTAAFVAAKTHLAALGGGICHLPDGAYKLTDFDLDERNILFVGESSGFSYERFTDPTKCGVRLIPGASAVYVARLKGGASIADAQGSGFKNLVIIDPVRGSHDYGLVIDSAATIVENVTVQDFRYVFAGISALNDNLFRKVAFLGATKCNFLVSEEEALSYMHPDITDVYPLSSTLWQMDGCVIRQGEFGAVLRDGIGASMGDTVVESNRQAGMYVYRTNTSTVRSLTFNKVWFENNYDAFPGYAGDLSSYVVTGNRAFLIGNASTYITWSALNQAGYQVVLDSQTRSGTGGCDNLTFNGGGLNCGNANQRAIRGLSGIKPKFNSVAFTGGDTPNLVKLSADVEGAIFVDPIPGNDPTAELTCLTDNFGANIGSRGVYLKSGTSYGAAELGGLYPLLGVTGGPLHFKTPVAGDPRRSDVRCLDDYFEDNTFAITWRVGAALPFTVNTQANSVTKIGRLVRVEMIATVTVATATGANDKLYTGISLPYAAAASGNVVGQCMVQATNGASLQNAGLSPMWMDTTASLFSSVDIFNALSIGQTFTIRASATYTAVT